MAQTFLADVQRTFSFFRDDPGHRLLESEVSDTFENAAVYFGSDRCRVRIIRERSQVFADFAPPDGPPHWCDAPLLLQYVGHEPLIEAYLRSDQRSLEALAALVHPFYSEIAALYTPARRERTIRYLKALQEENERRRRD